MKRGMIWGAPMRISLNEAAKRAGLSKSTVFRMVKAGKISAIRNEAGGFEIDLSEYTRVFQADAATHVEQRVMKQDAPANEAVPDADETVLTRLAAAEAELRVLREMLGEVKQSRDHWHEQAARLALVAPISVPPAPQVERGLLRRLFG